MSSRAESGAGAGALRDIDDRFLGQVRKGLDDAIRTVEVLRGRPHLDIEVLYDPHVDAPEGDGDPLADPERLVLSFRQRYNQLREPLRDQSTDIVLTSGNPVVQPGLGSGESVDPAAAQAAVWEPALGSLSSNDTTALGAHAGATASEETAAIFRIREEGAATQEPLALVVLLAWSGRVAAGAPARRTEALIRAMAESVVSHAPLHLICAVPDRDLSDGLIRECPGSASRCCWRARAAAPTSPWSRGRGCDPRTGSIASSKLAAASLTFSLALSPASTRSNWNSRSSFTSTNRSRHPDLYLTISPIYSLSPLLSREHHLQH